MTLMYTVMMILSWRTSLPSWLPPHRWSYRLVECAHTIHHQSRGEPRGGKDPGRGPGLGGCQLNHSTMGLPSLLQWLLHVIKLVLTRDVAMATKFVVTGVIWVDCLQRSFIAVVIDGCCNLWRSISWMIYNWWLRYWPLLASIVSYDSTL